MGGGFGSQSSSADEPWTLTFLWALCHPVPLRRDVCSVMFWKLRFCKLSMTEVTPEDTHILGNHNSKWSCDFSTFPLLFHNFGLQGHGTRSDIHRSQRECKKSSILIVDSRLLDYCWGKRWNRSKTAFPYLFAWLVLLNLKYFNPLINYRSHLINAFNRLMNLPSLITSLIYWWWFEQCIWWFGNKHLMCYFSIILIDLRVKSKLI